LLNTGDELFTPRAHGALIFVLVTISSHARAASCLSLPRPILSAPPYRVSRGVRGGSLLERSTRTDSRARARRRAARSRFRSSCPLYAIQSSDALCSC